MTNKHNSAVGIFSSHHDAESAVKELQKAGYDMQKLSVIGKDYHTEENVIVNGTEQEIERAKGILVESKADEANVHTDASAVA
ncbi:MAG: hypothetical protein PHE17_14050 [Thiothrix sp.]|uniref:general stress protein n=1 Tax=Thiothrix sp. TaxID=1032 RepID=UPI00262C1E27|nr:general stress protein [Thiothrix sp.]MDD5394131.1 hypothetical protein [Thiothrix sp.]